MIITSSGYFAGYRFYRLKGKQVWLWDLVDLERIKWEGPKVLAAGKHAIACDLTYDGLGDGTLAFNNFSSIGQGGTG